MYISCRFACIAVLGVFKSIRMRLLVCRKGCVGEKLARWVTRKDEKRQNNMAARHMGRKMIMLITLSSILSAAVRKLLVLTNVKTLNIGKQK